MMRTFPLLGSVAFASRANCSDTGGAMSTSRRQAAACGPPVCRPKLEALLGAKIVGEVPDVSDGAFGMARLAHCLHQRLTPSQGNVRADRRPKVPVSKTMAETLAQLAEALSTAERKVSPMQMAAQMLEEAVAALEDSRKCKILYS
jgi:hypothetical protein